jgi:hypothetical protein
MFTVTLRKLYITKILVKTAVVPLKCYNYIISQGNSNNLGEFFGIHFNLKIQVRETRIKVILKLPDGVASGAHCTVHPCRC